MVCKECGDKGHTTKTCLSNYKEIERVNSNLECSICLLKINKPKCKTSCGHVFHITCLREWLKNNITCPLCRKTINPEKENSITILGEEVRTSQGIQSQIIRSVIDTILGSIETYEDDYLLSNPTLIEEAIESYFENENLI